VIIRAHCLKQLQNISVVNRRFQKMESGMTKAEVLKKVILSQYKSVRQFAVEMDIPYSTLVTALERGIEGMAYSTVIRICDALSLNPVDFSPLEDGDGLSAQITTKRVMERYDRFNRAGRKKILDIMDDYSQIEMYTKPD
jgi:predicted transcriptional regulator